MKTRAWINSGYEMMKRSRLLPSLLLVVVSSAVGQEPGTGSGESWKRYTVKDAEFSVNLPGFPAMLTTKVARKSDGKVRLIRRLKTTSNGAYYIEAFENPEPKQSLKQFIDELSLSGDYKYDSATRRPVTIDGFDGIEYSFAFNNSSYVMQFLATEKHLYRFIAIGPVAERGAMMKFFPSIKLGKEPDGIEVSDSTDEWIYTGREVDVKARLLTKPEPNYTDAARKNRIAGIVVLKVVFSKSGQVENIHVVSGLPDGLTERSIIAAKRIKFTPAMKDGKPVSMWMQLEYNYIP
jgi:TonB family protein